MVSSVKPDTWYQVDQIYCTLVLAWVDYLVSPE